MTSATFATVITRDHLANARVLAARLREFHEEPLHVLCVDDLGPHVDVATLPFRVLSLDEVLPPEHRDMTFYYTAFELCNALKAFLLRWIFAHTGYDRVLFLDGDLFPVGSLADGFAALDDATILLSPHLLDPCPAVVAVDMETLCLQVGTFNGGCFGLRRAPETDRFVDWFTARSARHGFKGRHGMYGEQLWLNLVPSFFRGVTTWRHPGTNVANWNLHERVLRRAEGGYTANGMPLLFTHMSNWRFDAPDDWTLGRPLAPGTDGSIIAEIGRRYRDALADAGHEDCRRWPYGFGTFASGRPITLPMRREWYERVMAGATSAASPFDHPEWFRGPRYVEWKRYVPLPVKRFLHKSIASM